MDTCHSRWNLHSFRSVFIDGHCAWLIILITWGESIWRTSSCTCTWSREKKKTKWYLKLFNRLLNSTVLNSFVIYRQVTGRNKEQLSYRIQLVEGVFMKYARAAETQSVPGWQASDNTVPRLTERHFLRKSAPKTEKSKPQRRCVVCSKHVKKKTSVYYCQICDVGLCLEDCFELYHMKLNYWGNDNYFTASI